MSRAVDLKLVRMIPPRLPHDKSRTFDEATELHELSTDSYKITLRADWSFGPRVFGGYLIGIILRAAQEHCVHKGERCHADPGSWNVQYLASPAVGDAEVWMTFLRRGPKSTFLRGEIWQSNQLCVTATVLQLDLKNTQNRGLKLPSAGMPDLPTALFDMQHGEINADTLEQNGWETIDMKSLGHQFYIDKPYIKYYYPPGTDLQNTKHIAHPTLGPSFRDQWWTLGKQSLITPTNLPVILDLFSIIHVNYPAGSNYFTTSESLSCEMRHVSPGDGWEWIFCRSQLMECSGGKYVAHITVMNTRGEIVALAKMVNVLMSLKKLKEQKEADKPPPKL